MRRTARPWLKPLLLSLMIAAPGGAWAQSAAAPSAEAPMRLGRDAARKMAIDLLQQGQPAAAREIARGLVKADMGDFTALMILARAEAALGDHPRAAGAARRAYHAADEPRDRFAAAYVVAGALSAQENYALAQWWLRRAGEVSGDPRLETAARQQFRKVQAVNPWSTQLRFSVQPSSNVNGGPTSNSYTIGNYVFIDPTAVPLSGVEFGTQASVRRSFQLADPGGPQLSLGLAVHDRHYVLSDAARAAVPTARAEDFAMTEVAFSAGLTFPGSGRSATRAELRLGRGWRGGAPLTDTKTLELGRDLVRQDGARLGYGLSYTRQDRLDRASRSADIWEARGYWARRFDSGQLSFGAALSDTASASAEIAAQAGSLSVRFVPDQRVAGAVPSVSATFGTRVYDRVVYGTDVRRDTSSVLGAELFFDRVDYMGFAPTLGVTWSRNRSNVPIFDYEEYGLSFGIRSTF